MNRRKLRDLSILACIGLLVASRELFFVWLMIFFIVLFHPSKKRHHTSVRRQMYRDADEHGAKIPANPDVLAHLEKLYENYNRSIRLEPHLKVQYEEVLGDVWRGLALETQADGWLMLLRKVLTDWPRTQATTHSDIQAKLQKMQERSAQWSEARKEAYGGLS